MQTTPNRELLPPPLGLYAADVEATKISFKSRHMFGLAPVNGRFPIRSAAVNIAEPLTESTVRAEIDVSGFHTGNPARDGKVRSKAFLDAARFPTIVFDGTVAADRTTLEGTLTVCDVTRQVTLKLEQLEVEGRSFNARATTTIDRTEFGVTKSRGLASRYLTLTIDIRCVSA